MPTNSTLLQTALKVLVAWNDKHQPLPADVAILRNAYPTLADLTDDELACEVVQQDLGSGSFAQR